MTPPVRPTVLPILDAAGARAADAAAIAAGDAPDLLMARAAGHLARTVIELAGGGAGRRIDIVVGRGDNGGDGWAAAPLLTARGAQVRIIAPDGADGPTSEASSRVRARWIASGGIVWTGEVGAALVAPDGRARADVVVDCLLGTGASGPLRDGTHRAAVAIAAARAGGALVVACDVPTGVSADDGTVVDGAVAADATVTFGALKRGLVLAPGSAHAGRIAVGGLGERFATALHSGTASDAASGAVSWGLLTAEGARPDELDAHTEKRLRGVVLVVAGRIGSAGAAVLAGRGALAAGAGLVTLAVPEPVRAEVAAMHPALMVVGLPADTDGGLHADAVHALPLDGVDAVVAGPGLGTGSGAAEVIRHLRRTCPRLVLDADALNVHRDGPEALADHAAPPGALVLTPHARELDRIAGEGTFAARAARVPELATRWGVTIVAKGPGTLIASPAGAVHVTPFDEPALATAGTGDVLAGMLAATLAAEANGPLDGADRQERLARTVWWHAAAGRVAGAAAGGLPDATAVLAALPQVLSVLRRRSDSPEAVASGPSARVWLDGMLHLAPGSGGQR